MDWNEIKKHYDIARECLWNSPKKSVWCREEDKGMYHLWTAYYEAKISEEKDGLLYARILWMMSCENHQLTDYEKYHKYLLPAKEINDSLIAAGKVSLSEKELSMLETNLKLIGNKLKRMDDSKEELEAAYNLIEGLRHDFNFHDGKVVHFEHTEDTALMKIKDGDSEEIVTFEFKGLFDITISVDPVVDWIFDFYCYKHPEGSNRILFDIGLYQIFCEKIRVL